MTGNEHLREWCGVPSVEVRTPNGPMDFYGREPRPGRPDRRFAYLFVPERGEVQIVFMAMDPQLVAKLGPRTREFLSAFTKQPATGTTAYDLFVAIWEVIAEHDAELFPEDGWRSN